MFLLIYILIFRIHLYTHTYDLHIHIHTEIVVFIYLFILLCKILDLSPVSVKNLYMYVCPYKYRCLHIYNTCISFIALEYV